MNPRDDHPREARLLICGVESDESREYGDRMDALEREERLSRHYDACAFVSHPVSHFAPLDAEASPASTGGEARRLPLTPAAARISPPRSGAGRELLDAKQAA